MTYLLDTHALLWFLAKDDRLSKKAYGLIEEPNNQILVSIASLWEISIKASLGKLPLKRPYSKMLNDIQATGLDILPITFAHTAIQHNLPLHHRDPFDRLLAAQAIALQCPILSKDKALDPYLNPQSPRIW